MKTRLMKPWMSVLVLATGLIALGCGNAAQQRAFERAAEKEKQLTTETAPAVIAEYQQVIRLEPGSRWAKQAQERIAAIEAKVKAEELHKSVFQEHGID